MLGGKPKDWEILFGALMICSACGAFLFIFGAIAAWIASGSGVNNTTQVSSSSFSWVCGWCPYIRWREKSRLEPIEAHRPKHRSNLTEGFQSQREELLARLGKKLLRATEEKPARFLPRNPASTDNTAQVIREVLPPLSSLPPQHQGDIEGDYSNEESGTVSGVYALLLDGGNYYVGKANDVAKRVNEHKQGGGAGWTKKHPVRHANGVEPDLSHNMKEAPLMLYVDWQWNEVEAVLRGV